MANTNLRHFASSMLMLVGGLLIFGEYTMTNRSIQTLNTSELQAAAQMTFDSYLPLFLGALGAASIAASAPIVFARKHEQVGSLMVGIAVALPVSLLVCWSWTGTFLLLAAHAKSAWQLQYFGAAVTVFVAGWFLKKAMAGPADRQQIRRWYASLSTDPQAAAQYHAARVLIVGVSTLSVILAFLVDGGAILLCRWRPPTTEHLIWVLLLLRLGAVVFVLGMANYFIALTSPDGYRALVGQNPPE